MSLNALTRVNVLGTWVTASSFEAGQAFLAECVQARRPAMMSPATVHSVMLARHRPAYQALVNRADYVMADGMPMVWALRLLGHAAERVHGDDFLLACCARFPEWRHFLLGGAAGQPEAVADELRRRFAGVKIAGVFATPVRPVPEPETDRIVRAIRETRTDVIWLGMGTPAHDEWMAANASRAGVPMVGVGGAFDVLAGRTRPAPEWSKRIGLQWTSRLMQEPRRLWRRYLLYNPQFVIYFALQLLGLRRPER